MRRPDRMSLLHRGRRALTLAAVALLCAGVCLSCSDDPSVDVTTQCLAFLPSEGTASGNVITRTGAESTCNELDIEFVATDIDDILAADIHIAYPNGLAILILMEAGPLMLGSTEGVACAQALSEYGVDCTLTDDFNNGTVQFSLIRTQQPPSTVNAPAEGAVLATLTFLQLTTLPGAQGPFDFTLGKLLDDGTPPANIINWADDPSTFVGGQMIIETR